MPIGSSLIGIPATPECQRTSRLGKQLLRHASTSEGVITESGNHTETNVSFSLKEDVSPLLQPWWSSMHVQQAKSPLLHHHFLVTTARKRYKGCPYPPRWKLPLHRPEKERKNKPGVWLLNCYEGWEPNSHPCPGSQQWRGRAGEAMAFMTYDWHWPKLLAVDKGQSPWRTPPWKQAILDQVNKENTTRLAKQNNDFEQRCNTATQTSLELIKYSCPRGTTFIQNRAIKSNACIFNF